MSELSQLPNIGKVLDKNLTSIGIQTIEDFKKTDTLEMFIKIRLLQDSGACLHMLYGIEGAKQGIPYSQLSKKTKDNLKQFFVSIKK